jgi:hypothetical protein
MALTEAEKQARQEARREAQQQESEKQARRQTVVDDHYMQSYRRYRDWQATEDRLRSLVPKALGVLERTLDSGDGGAALKAALSVLRAAGLQNLERPDMPDHFLTAHEIDPELEELPV